MPSWFDSLLGAGIVPDFLVRFGTRRLLDEHLQEYAFPDSSSLEAYVCSYVQRLKEEDAIALATRESREQHYEVPTDFFKLCLGSRLKYSCGYWPEGVDSLDESEVACLDLYVERARLEDGQTLLDLGCGWGSLTLYLAERFPSMQITAVSHSRTQREYIEEECRKRSFDNVRVLTSDVNMLDFKHETFDRICSVEMFEHVKNYNTLLKMVSSWLKSDGLFFVHIFCHKNCPYDFVDGWMAENFFTGGTMPSADLLTRFENDLRLRRQWLVNGLHYGRTCEAWLQKMDDYETDIRSIFKEGYPDGNDTKRVFYIACAELFKFNDGREWMVTHMLFGKEGNKTD